MNPQNQDTVVYVAPAIVFESTITTRAGSVPGGGRSDAALDLFGTD